MPTEQEEIQLEDADINIPRPFNKVPLTRLPTGRVADRNRMTDALSLNPIFLFSFFWFIYYIRTIKDHK